MGTGTGGGTGSDPSESLGHLRLDKRLQKRRGWIEKAELDAELAKLPDVSDKIQEEPPEPSSDAPSAGASESDETPGASGG